MRKIMVVEDDFSIAGYLRELLEASGYTVPFAADGRNALDIARKERPEIILLDIMLPDLSGFEVCRMIKSDPKTRSIKIIVTTALSRMGDVEKAFSAGATDYVIKPFDNTRLLEKIKQVLASPVK